MREIDFRFNPYRNEISLSIDGRDEAASNAFSELPALRKYPLSCWAFRHGSWRGLRHYLQDLGRGEPLSIEFSGRACDYKVLRCALEGDEEREFELFFGVSFHTDNEMLRMRELECTLRSVWQPELRDIHPYHCQTRQIIETSLNRLEQVRKWQIEVVTSLDDPKVKEFLAFSSYPALILGDVLEDPGHLVWLERCLERMERTAHSLIVLDPSKTRETPLRTLCRRLGLSVVEKDSPDVEMERRRIEELYLSPLVVGETIKDLSTLVEAYAVLASHYDHECQEMADFKPVSGSGVEITQEQVQAYNVRKEHINWLNGWRSSVKTWQEEVNQLWRIRKG